MTAQVTSRTRHLAAALGLLVLLVLMPVSGQMGVVHHEQQVVCSTAFELTEQPIEEKGNVDRVAHGATPMPMSGRLRVREADRIGPRLLHLPPPARRIV
ncbi:MAG: hypothetical protein MK074_05990 [Phycisphaerales bacterium]|nr:hypothetical protein [Phycisphaerales bacterium]